MVLCSVIWFGMAWYDILMHGMVSNHIVFVLLYFNVNGMVYYLIGRTMLFSFLVNCNTLHEVFESFCGLYIFGILLLGFHNIV